MLCSFIFAPPFSPSPYRTSRSLLRTPPKATADPSPAILSIDIGTSATKAALVPLKPAPFPSCRHPHPTFTPRPYHVTQAPADWIQSTLQSCQNVLQNDTPVVAIAFTGQMQTLSAVGAAPPLLDNCALVYSDARAEQSATDLRLPATSIPPKLKLLPDGDYNLFLGAADYVLHAFAAEPKPLVTDPTTVSTTSLTLPPHRVYNEELLHDADLGSFLPKLPAILNKPSVCAYLSSEMATLLNRPDLAGIPLIHAGGDAYSATAGAGCEKPGGTYAYIGTSGWVARTSEERRMENGLFTLGHFGDERLNVVAASVASAGGALQYGCKQLLGIDITELDHLAKQSKPGANGVTFVPYIQGRRCPRPNELARGALVGVGGGVEKKDLARAIVEGVAFSLYEAGETLGNVEEVRMIGGACKCASLVNILAGGWKVQRGEMDAGLVGAAKVAAQVLGVDFEQGAEDEEFRVEGEAGWREGFERWSDVVGKMEELWR